MQNNISKFKTIYKSLISILVIFVVGFGALIYFTDPFVDYVAPYQFAVLFAIILFLIISLAVIYLRLKIFKNLNFLQGVYRQFLNCFVFACSFTFFLLLIYTNSLSLISFLLFTFSLFAYCLFEFIV